MSATLSDGTRADGSVTDATRTIVTGRRVEILNATELLRLAHGADASGDGKQRRA